MSFWEKGYLATGLAVLIAGAGYFYVVWQQSIGLEQIAPPNWGTFGTYLVVVIIISAGSFIALGSWEAAQTKDPETVGEFDERDRFVNMKSLAAASYITSIGAYISLVWFLFHHNGDLLFHSLVGALMIGEAAMCFLHVFNYNRAY